LFAIKNAQRVALRGAFAAVTAIYNATAGGEPHKTPMYNA